jgi:hypothetical protein
VIICLDFDSSSLTIADNFTYEIQPFKDKCACISHLLSIENKIISFIASAMAGKLVVPLVHNHTCIRYIYIYQNPDIDLDTSWIKNFGKIRGTWSSMDQLKEQMVFDIRSYTTRSSHWSRCQEIFIELWRQSSSKPLSNAKPLPKDEKPVGIALPNVVMLFCSDYRPFHFSHEMIKINEFDDIKQCTNFIKRSETVSSTFLIVCTNSIDFSEEIRSLMQLDSVHATYIFSTATSDTTD